MKVIEVRCTYTKLVPLDELVSIQGNLKRPVELNKLKTVIKRNGFIIPLYCWQQHPDDKDFRLIDGVHRVKALLELRNEGYELPDGVPAVMIQAKTRAAAKKLLLLASSRYGQISRKSFESFAVGLNWDELREELSKVDFKMLFTKELTPEDVNPKMGKGDKGGSGNVQSDMVMYRIQFSNKRQKDQFWKLVRKLSKEWDMSHQQTILKAVSEWEAA